MTTPTALPGAQALSEWSSRVGGFIEGCGEASALVAAHIVNGQPLSTSELTATIQSAVARGATVDRGGAQTAPQVQSDLARLGVQSSVTYGASGLGSRLDSALARGEPVIIGESNGSALNGETAGLRGHFVTVVGGSSGGGYRVADPNTAVAQSGGLISDSLAQLLRAAPFATITPTTAPRAPAATGAPLSLSASNPLDPTTWVTGAETALTGATQRIGLVFFGGLVVLVGVLVLFFAADREQDSSQDSSGQTAQVADAIGEVAAA